jgi:hypothetical protein
LRQAKKDGMPGVRHPKIEGVGVLGYIIHGASPASNHSGKPEVIVSHILYCNKVFKIFTIIFLKIQTLNFFRAW